MNVPATHTPVTPAFQPVWMKKEIIAAIAFRVTPRDQTTSFATVCMIYGCSVVNSVSVLNKWLFDDTNWTSWAKWVSDNITCISYVAWHIREALYVLSIFMTAILILLLLLIWFLSFLYYMSSNNYISHLFSLLFKLKWQRQVAP